MPAYIPSLSVIRTCRFLVQLFGGFSSFCADLIHFMPFYSLIITYIYIKYKLCKYVGLLGIKLPTSLEFCKVCEDIFFSCEKHLLGPFSGFFMEIETFLISTLSLVTLGTM